MELKKGQKRVEKERFGSFWRSEGSEEGQGVWRVL